MKFQSITSVPGIDMAATGRNIYTLRTSRGLSVADLQRFFGFDAPQAIYKWQNGKTLPSIDNLYALSCLFEVSIEDILITQRPKIQVLPQEKSCGSGLFGGIFHRLASGITARKYRIPRSFPFPGTL